MSEYESFLLRIAANPADDTARLVFADWLEENGQAARAEYVRDGVEAFRVGMEHYQPLEPQATEWRRAVPCPTCDATGRMQLGRTELVRGKVKFVSSSASIDCPECWKTGDAGGLLRKLYYVMPDGPVSPGTGSFVYNSATGGAEKLYPVRVEWSRGFISAVHCRLSDVVDERGTVTEWAKAVCRWHPVERFVVGDRVPYHNAADRWLWLPCPVADRMDRAVLPKAVYDALAGDQYQIRRGYCKNYVTREAAVLSLETALADVARGAGSPAAV